MQIAIFLAVVITISISENSPHEPLASGASRGWLAVAAVLGVAALAAFGSMGISRSLRQAATAERPRQAIGWLQLFARLQRLHLAVWLAVLAVTLGLLGWPQLVRYNWGLDGVPLFADLAVLMPVWLPWCLSWAGFYEVEKAVRRWPSEHPSNDPVAAGRTRFVWTQARHFLGLGLIPALILLTTDSLFALLLPGWKENPHRWTAFAIPMIALVLFFPLLLSKLWCTVELPDGTLRRRLADLAGQAGLPCQRFQIWQTERRLVNAAVAGILPSVRRVFLTDGLLMHLNDGEVATVVLHEFGHVQRHHLLLRLLLLTLPIPFIMVIYLVFPELMQAATSGHHPGTWNAVVNAGPSWLGGLLLPLATAGYGILTLGWYSRHLEHDADLYVSRLGHGTELVQTLRRLSNLSGEDPTRASWLHPSTRERIRRLTIAETDPQSADQHHRRVNRMTGLLLSLWLVSLLLVLASL